jgi:peptidoglycan hydrolase CwlO-like protein
MIRSLLLFFGLVKHEFDDVVAKFDNTIKHLEALVERKKAEVATHLDAAQDLHGRADAEAARLHAEANLRESLATVEQRAADKADAVRGKIADLLSA